MRVHCTPTTVEIIGGRRQEVTNPIARALEVAGPGSVIVLDPGDYAPFTIGAGARSNTNAQASGGSPGRPVVVEGRGVARIVGTQDAIGIDQKTANGHITFRNLVIVPGQRAGVIFYRQGEGRVHRGFSFEDCHILGSYDHVTSTGAPSKWGLSGHSLADFRFVGLREPARVERVKREHGFYIQNHRGPILIENVRARALGRTFCQFTARAKEGPRGEGDITIRHCDVADVCIAAGDAYKGGSALTFSGRLACTILLEKNSVRAGFQRALRALTLGGQPYGTGALVAWQEAGAPPNGTLILRDNRFEYAEGCGDRPVVSIGGTRRALLVGTNVIHSGGSEPALALDPVDPDGELVSAFEVRAYVAPRTRLRGKITRRGEVLEPSEVRRLKLEEE